MNRSQRFNKAAQKCAAFLRLVKAAGQNASKRFVIANALKTHLDFQTIFVQKPAISRMNAQLQCLSPTVVNKQGFTPHCHAGKQRRQTLCSRRLLHRVNLAYKILIRVTKMNRLNFPVESFPA